MLKAFDLGMCDGEYVFYAIDMLPDESVANSWPLWKVGDDRDDDARRAFEAVFHVSTLVEVSKLYENPRNVAPSTAEFRSAVSWRAFTS